MQRRETAGCIRAGIDDKLDVQRSNRSVRFDANLRGKDFRMARILAETFFRRRYQSHGAADLACKKQRSIVGRRRDLGAKAAANVRYSHAHFVRLETEEMCEIGAIAHRRAGGNPDVCFTVNTLREKTAD